MAVITKQELEDAAVDAATLEAVANSTGTTTTRLGDTVKTVRQAIDDIISTAPAQTYSTQAALLADLTPVNGTLAYALDTDKYYVKNGASGSGSWDTSSTSRVDMLEKNAVRQSIYPDPLFELRSAGQNSFNGNQLTSSNWVYDASFDSPLRKGAWKHDSSYSSLSFWYANWAMSAPDDILQPGDTFSIGMLVQAASGGAGRLTHRFTDGNNNGNYVTGQVTQSFTGTGDVQLVQMNNQQVPTSVTTTGIALYLYDASPATDIHVIAMWIVKDVDAGAYPPGYRSPTQFNELFKLKQSALITEVTDATSDITALQGQMTTAQTDIDAAELNVERNQDYLNTVLSNQNHEPLHSAYVFSSGEGGPAKAISSTFAGWANPWEFDGTSFDLVKIYIGSESANAAVRVAIWNQDGTLAAEGYTKTSNGSGSSLLYFDGYLTVKLDSFVTGSAEIKYISIQSIDGTTRLMPSNQVSGFTNVPDPATYPQKYLNQGAGREHYTISQWSNVSSDTGWPIDFKLYNSGNDQKTLPADYEAENALNQMLTGSADRLFTTTSPVHSNGVLSGFVAITSTFSGWAQPFDWDGTPFDIVKIAWRTETAGHPVRVSIWSGDRQDMIASSIITPLKDRGYFYVKLDTRVEQPRFSESTKFNVLYVCAESLDHEVKMSNSTGSGTIDPADPVTYPQLYTTVTSSASYLGNWSVVSGNTGRDMVFDLYDSTLLQEPSATDEDDNALSAPLSGYPVTTPRLFGIEDIEVNVFFDNLYSANSEKAIDCVGLANDGGRQFSERFYLLPTSTPINGSQLTINVKDPDELYTIANASYNLYTCAADGAAGATRRVLCIGDSTTNAGIWTQRLLTQATNNSDGVQPTLVGTRGTAPNLHEGRGGWRVSTYYQPTGSNVAENPFVQSDGDKFDMAYYITNTSQAAPDIVIWHLGINDVFGQTSDAGVNSIATTFLSQLDQMIGVTAASDVGSIKESNANVVNLIAVPIVPTGSQDAFGYNYTTGQHRDRYKRNITVLAHRIVEHYKDSESDKIFLLPWNAVLDPDKSFPTQSWTSQYFPSDTVTRQSNGVHPSTVGYNQMGDAAWAALNVLVTNGDA
jgi:lysophospholipase L1-like esterase